MTGTTAEGGGGSKDDGVALIGHRGFAGVAPENTVGAMERSVRTGRSDGAAGRPADMVEIDVVPCGGSPHEGEAFEVVVFHDDALAERDGGERGLLTNVDDLDAEADDLVWETPCETVLSGEVLDSGETIPTMRAVFEALPPAVGVNVELKNPGSRDLRFAEDLSGSDLAAQKDIWRPFVEAVFDVASDFEHHVLASSFYEAALATTRETNPDVPVAFLFWDDIGTGLDITDTYDAEALHPPVNMIEGTPFFGDGGFGFDNVPDGGFDDIDLVATAHDAGREVNVWTVRSWYEAEQLLDAGVDGLIADFPDLLRFGEFAER